MYMCIRDIDFSLFYDFSIIFLFRGILFLSLLNFIIV